MGLTLIGLGLEGYPSKIIHIFYMKSVIINFLRSTLKIAAKKILKFVIRNEENKKELLNIILNKVEKRCLQFKEEGYLHEVGWFNSYLQKKPVNLLGEPIPWITYPAIQFLEERLTPDIRIFEFGCGASTLYFSNKLKAVTSIEHDKVWYDKCLNEIHSENTRLLHVSLNSNGAYTKAATNTGEDYNILLVDGRKRVQCIFDNYANITDDGVIILDDSERERYKEAIVFLKSKGFKTLNFWGTAPTVFNHKCTTFFYRENNCLNI